MFCRTPHVFDLHFQTELLKQLSDILKNGGNGPVARMQAGIQLKNALYSKDATLKVEYQQRWLQFPEDVRTYIKQNVSCLILFYVRNGILPAFQHRNAHFGAVGIAGLYIGRLRNCLPFLTSFTQSRMANLHIKCFDINAYQRLECYRALR